MFCFKCGQKLPDNARFCGACGAKIPEKTAAAPPDAPNAAVESNAPAAPIVPVEQAPAMPPQAEYPAQPYIAPTEQSVQPTYTAQQPYTAPTQQEPQPTYTAQQPYTAPIQQEPQPTYTAQQSYVAPIAAPAAAKKRKKSIVLPVVLITVGLVIVAAAVILCVMFFAGDKSGDDPSGAGSDIDCEDETDAEEGGGLVDTSPAADGHYTTLDMSKYIGRTAAEIIAEFGNISPAVSEEVNFDYRYGSVGFTVVDDFGVTEMYAAADIVEYGGEALDKTYGELIGLLGLPIYESISYGSNEKTEGRVGYLINNGLYVSIRFDGRGNKASSVYVSEYSDKLPIDMNNIEELFQSTELTEYFGAAPRQRGVSSQGDYVYYTYNAFSFRLSSNDNTPIMIQALPFAFAANGESFDKTPSEIKALIGEPDYEGNDPSDDSQHYLWYVIGDTLDLVIWFNDADGKAQNVIITPQVQQEEETLGNADARYVTRNGYNCSLTLDPYGGFVLSVNRLYGYTDFSGTYYQTSEGYRFEVVVGRSELREFEMKWNGNALVYYGETVGTTMDGVTIYYPERKIEDIMYNGRPVTEALKYGTDQYGNTILCGDFIPYELSVDGISLQVSEDELEQLLGSPEYVNEYDRDWRYVVYWLESRTMWKTFKVTFTYHYSLGMIEIEEMIIP